MSIFSGSWFPERVKLCSVLDGGGGWGAWCVYGKSGDGKKGEKEYEKTRKEVRMWGMD